MYFKNKNYNYYRDTWVMSIFYKHDFILTDYYIYQLEKRRYNVSR